MKPSISIHPKEACECAHPLPGRTYMKIRRCELCGFLMPRSQMERAELRAERYDMEAREGLWPQAHDHSPKAGASKAEFRRVAGEILKADPSITRDKWWTQLCVRLNPPITQSTFDTGWAKKIRDELDLPGVIGRPKGSA